ncbi:proteasome component [Streptomyces azureus]|uniref:Proteasome component n=1 Tax=Streptomyces azureus TaxID=146537 RepID=A0A0K8PHD5_STRAJ|nr:proteasome component [Streptomyces azureus]
MTEAAERAAQLPGAQPIHLYKNSTDNKGASYATHENYLMKRETPFSDSVRHLTPFFVSRQVFTGAGRVGIGQDGHGFRLSQIGPGECGGTGCDGVRASVRTAASWWPA